MDVLPKITIETWVKDTKDPNMVEVYVKYPSMPTVGKFVVHRNEAALFQHEIIQNFRNTLRRSFDE
jgi:hypothetical protein